MIVAVLGTSIAKSEPWTAAYSVELTQGGMPVEAFEQAEDPTADGLKALGYSDDYIQKWRDSYRKEKAFRTQQTTRNGTLELLSLPNEPHARLTWSSISTGSVTTPLSSIPLISAVVNGVILQITGKQKLEQGIDHTTLLAGSAVAKSYDVHSDSVFRSILNIPLGHQLFFNPDYSSNDLSSWIEEAQIGSNKLIDDQWVISIAKDEVSLNQRVVAGKSRWHIELAGWIEASKYKKIPRLVNFSLLSARDEVLTTCKLSYKGASEFIDDGAGFIPQVIMVSDQRVDPPVQYQAHNGQLLTQNELAQQRPLNSVQEVHSPDGRPQLARWLFGAGVALVILSIAILIWRARRS
jgi:hypothetical protein